MRFASLTSADGWAYKFTQEDWLWSIRMLVGEAGAANWDERWKQLEGEAILWTMLQRLYLLRTIYPTYTSLILAYSQPINPKWRNRGTAEEQARRARFATMPASAAPPGVVALVTRFVQGQVPGDLYTGLVHFIAPGVTPAPEAIGPVTIPGMQPRSNVFFKVSTTQNWPSPSELFKFKFSTTAALLAGGITLVAIGAGIAYYYWIISQTGTAGLGRTPRSSWDNSQFLAFSAWVDRLGLKKAVSEALRLRMPPQLVKQYRAEFLRLHAHEFKTARDYYLRLRRHAKQHLHVADTAVAKHFMTGTKV